MSVVFSDELLRSARMTPGEFTAEVAALLYQGERLTLAQAARLAGMGRVEFQHFLAGRDIPLNLDASDLAEDLESLRSLGRLVGEDIPAGSTPDHALFREIALTLYAREKMTLEQAAGLAEMPQLDFRRLLAGRGVEIHYDVAEFEEDLRTLRELGRL